MKSKASYFNFSPTLIQENFRRFWAVSALGFLVYFLSGIFPILMSYGKINNLSFYIKMTLENQQPFFAAVDLLMPIAAAVVVLRYLQQSSSVTYMNALPVSRARLFNSNLISGWLMSMIPVLATGILLFLLSKPTHEITYYSQDKPVFGPDIFTNAAVAGWLWQTVLVVTFIYVVAIFAGMVVGNSVLQMLLAFTLCFLVPAIHLVLCMYFEQYLWGYVPGYEETLNLLPWLAMLRGEPFSIGLTAVYLAIIVLLVVFSGVLNYKRKLEKAGDGVIFGFMVPVLCYLIAFLGMSLFGFYFYAMSNESYSYMYAGMAAGALILFIIARMLVYKTPRIFNKQSVKSFLVFGLAAVFFVCALSFDLTGFEDRVPNATGVTGATVNAGAIQGVNAQEDGRYNSEFYGNGQQLQFTDPAALATIEQYHRYIVDNKARFKDADAVDYYYNATTVLTYYKDGKRSMARSYPLPYNKAAEEYMAVLYESREFKDFYSLKNVNFGAPKSITVQYLNSSFTVNKSDVDTFIALLDRDFAARTYSEHLANELCYAQVILEYPHAQYKDSTQTITLDIKRSDVNTIKWLEERGYAQLRAQDVTAVTAVTVTYEYPAKGSEDDPKSEDISIKSDEIKTITDRSQIAYILEHGQSYLLPGVKEYYIVSLQNVQPEYYSESTYDENYGSIQTKDGYRVLALYFTPETAPDFIKK